jgi:hypothetical protein
VKRPSSSGGASSLSANDFVSRRASWSSSWGRVPFRGRRRRRGWSRSGDRVGRAADRGDLRHLPGLLASSPRDRGERAEPVSGAELVDEAQAVLDLHVLDLGLHLRVELEQHVRIRVRLEVLAVGDRVEEVAVGAEGLAHRLEQRAEAEGDQVPPLGVGRRRVARGDEPERDLVHRGGLLDRDLRRLGELGVLERDRDRDQLGAAADADDLAGAP